jgi:hypothetical protein
VSKKTETAAQFITHLHAKQFDQAAAMLVENVVMAVSQVGQIEGRGAVEGALRMASDSGRGLERVGWSAPLEKEDGTVLLAGKAPAGLLGVVAKLLKKQVAVTISCAFADDDKISKLDVVTS